MVGKAFEIELSPPKYLASPSNIHKEFQACDKYHLTSGNSKVIPLTFKELFKLKNK